MMTTIMGIALSTIRLVGLSVLMLTAGSVVDWFIQTFTYVDEE